MVGQRPRGGSLVATESRVAGPVHADHASVTSLSDTTVHGPVSITASTGWANISGDRLTGPVTLAGNTGSQPIITATTAAGPLRCTGND